MTTTKQRPAAGGAYTKRSTTRRPVAAMTARTKRRGAPQRLRAPGLDDGESPFLPIPGLSSAGEY